MGNKELIGDKQEIAREKKKARQKRWYIKWYHERGGREQIRQRDAALKNDPEYRAWRYQYRKSVASLEVNRNRENRKSKKYKERYPEKGRAHRQVRTALKNGVLVRPAACDVCKQIPPPSGGRLPSIQAHHDDYSKPLEVRWMCTRCHSAHHRSLLGEAA